MDEQRIDDLSQRLVRLERQNRRLQWWVALLLVVFGAGLLMGQSKPNSVEKVIKAEAFYLVDPDGEAKAGLNFRQPPVLGCRGTEPQLVFVEAKGKPRVMLGLHLGAPGLILYDENRELALSLARMGSPFEDRFLILRNEKRRSEIRLELTRREPQLTLIGNGGKPVASLGLVDGAPRLTLWDKEGKKVAFSAP